MDVKLSSFEAAELQVRPGTAKAVTAHKLGRCARV